MNFNSPPASDLTVLLWFVIVLVLISLVVLTVFRFVQLGKETSPGETSLTRPYLALLLVGSVVIITAASLAMDDPDLQKSLVGAVISLSSAAVGFYFASAEATDARRDLLKSTAQTVQVPDLKGMTIEAAKDVVKTVPLSLIVPPDLDPSSHKTTHIGSQFPPAGLTKGPVDGVSVWPK
ncbi:hypothetical protein [Arthrobacter sp. HMWF013]|uniref:hypothetical protein n=1 Tax=Arthrobacter sp. HMWF013 TaxID=2056849 RepID=UPI000D34BE1B|nr:hypothetical protein [Arthrobacter sp. HMWF013]PTT67012.1 hypothetical protein DBR22_09875 [Arthrobacter sp. HMWF013]